MYRELQILDWCWTFSARDPNFWYGHEVSKQIYTALTEQSFVAYSPLGASEHRLNCILVYFSTVFSIFCSTFQLCCLSLLAISFLFSSSILAHINNLKSQRIINYSTPDHRIRFQKTCMSCWIAGSWILHPHENLVSICLHLWKSRVLLFSGSRESHVITLII